MPKTDLLDFIVEGARLHVRVNVRIGVLLEQLLYFVGHDVDLDFKKTVECIRLMSLLEVKRERSNNGSSSYPTIYAFPLFPGLPWWPYDDIRPLSSE